MAPAEGSRVRIAAPDSMFDGRTGTVEEVYADRAGNLVLGVRPDAGLFAMPIMRFSPDEVEFVAGEPPAIFLDCVRCGRRIPTTADAKHSEDDEFVHAGSCPPVEGDRDAR